MQVGQKNLTNNVWSFSILCEFWSPNINRDLSRNVFDMRQKPPKSKSRGTKIEVWRRLGASRGRLGASWGRLGGVLGHPGALLRCLGDALGASWSVLEAS